MSRTQHYYKKALGDYDESLVSRRVEFDRLQSSKREQFMIFKRKKGATTGNLKFENLTKPPYMAT
jgi:hypothetical protein